MLCMVVTLDVTRLSGWLNADADCRVERRAYDAGRDAGGRGGGTSSVQGRDRLQIRGRARGGAHAKHLIHECDAGGVEAQRLVERPRKLPRVERRAYAAGRGAPGGRRAACDRGASAACRGEGSTADWEQGTVGSRARGGAHVEHDGHGCDFGLVEAQRLVERRRILPRVERRADGAVRAAARKAAGSGRPRGTQRAGEGSNVELGQGTRGGAHGEHDDHVRDAGGVEAQRLVERRRGLPSRKEDVRCGARCGPGAGGRGLAAAHERHARREGQAVKAGGGL
eukprot:scaffold37044_cov60-Phaeocystis_antarctica.AAC.2